MQEYKYKFSVIIPIYNVEKYLEETIESVINQTIGFEENIQMILVNDGSPDNSEKICKSYLKEYPENIKYIKQKNAGVSAARNNGLKHAEGKYINFLDSDDKWELNAFEKVYTFFEKNYEKMNFVSCRMKFFDVRRDYHPLDYKYKKTKIVDTNVEYDFVQLSSCSCFFKKEEIIKYKFDEKVKYTEDGKLINEMLLKFSDYGILHNVIYLYRKREDESSAVQNNTKTRDWFLITPILVYKYLFDLSKKELGYISPLIQYTTMYDLQWRLRDSVPKILTSKENQEYIENIVELLKEIDDHIIFDQKNSNIQAKLYALSLKNNEFSINNFKIFKNELKYKNIKILEIDKHPFASLNVLEINNNKILLSGKLSMLNECDVFDFYIKKGNKYFKLDMIDSGKKMTFFNDYSFEKHKNYIFETSIKPGDKISFYLNYKKTMVRIAMNFGKHAKINKILKNNYYSNNNYFIKTNKNRILIYKHSLKKQLYNEINCWIEILKSTKIKSFMYRFLAFFIRIIRNQLNLKSIWIFSDRINFAGDNGEALYKYSIEKKDKIKKYFLISKESKDYKKIKKYGHVIRHNSFKHKLLFLLSPYIISSHADDYVINPFKRRWYLLSNFYDYKYVFLQHGITKDDLSDWLNKTEKNINLFITATKKEYESILNYNYSYDKNIVKLTGFPRYDLLNDKSYKYKKKFILLSPTWRKKLSSELDLESGSRKYNSNFKNTEYYNFYNSLINSKKLISILKNNDIKIRFILHPNMIQQAQDFENNDCIEIVSTNFNYKEEFEKSSLLITDYSSVFFDFGYLKKPVIYSQFDKETFFENHTYDKGYFSYEKDGFGDVLTTVDEVIKKIEYYVKNNFKMEDKYKKRVENTFEYIDQNNCKRVYEEILKLDNNN